MGGEIAKLKPHVSVVLSQPHTLEDICKHVSAGGSLRDYCFTRNIRYCDVTWWLQQDDARCAQFERAKESRKNWAREMVFGHLLEVADAKISDILDDDGNVLPPGEWPETARHVISSYTVSEREGVKKSSIRTKDGLKAMEMLGKWLGMFKDQVEHSGTVSLADMVTKAAAAAKNKPDEDEDE